MSIESAYRDDLAYIHDAGHGDVAREAARRLAQELTQRGFQDGTIVDLGCGSGILAEHMLDAGYSVVGIDASAAMVALARNRAPAAEFRVGSFVAADLPTCIAVTAIGEVLSYGFDSANDQAARTDLVERVYRSLVPGGLWLFDIAGPERAKPGESRRTFAEGPDWAVLVETDFDATTSVLTRHITSFRQVGEFYRRHAERHRLTLIDPEMMLESLRRVGFEAEIIPSYGTTGLPQGDVAFLARKNGNVVKRGVDP
jgi:SAM-dependent methyltransferase